MDKMPTGYLYEKGTLIGKATARMTGSISPDDGRIHELRLWAQSIVDEIDKWREDEVGHAVLVQTKGTDETDIGEPVVWEFQPVVDGELGEGLWLVRVMAITREHAISIAVNWSTRTDRGADDEILSAEQLPLGRDETETGAPNWLVVIGKRPPVVTVRTSRGGSVHGKQDEQRTLCGVVWESLVADPQAPVDCRTCLRWIGGS